MKRKRIAILVLGVLVAMVGVEVEHLEPTETVGEAELRPLRIEFSLAERARAAIAPADGFATENGLNLRLDLVLGKEPVAGAVERATTTDAAALPVGGPVRLELLARQRDLGTPGESGDAFGAKSWVVAPPPPPPPPPPVIEAPKAPPLPFRFMGQLDEGNGQRIYFLARGTEMISASVGENIDNTYLLERADGGSLRFVYLPLREAQILQTGTGP
jgi:hypothetical protein